MDNAEEESLHLKIQKMDDTIAKLVNAVKMQGTTLFGTKNEKIYRISLKDVYYFEAVEKRVFVYLQDEFYEIKDKLYQIEERYTNLQLVRISKSVIVNMDKIEAIYPAFSGRFELKLDNDEILQISRHYVSNLKQKLGMEG